MSRIEQSEKQLTRRCPRLGGPVSFRSCRTCEPEKQACWKIIDCWWETFDVVRYLHETLPQDQLSRIVNPKPPSKMAGILRCAEKARRRQGKSDP